MASQSGSTDINSSQFDSEAYVNNLILKKGLDELVTVEEEMVTNVRRLDYEMQHLVYENYNKFLTATNTVKKMQDEFSIMDDKMVDLSEKIKRISDLSTKLSTQFSENRETVNKLNESSRTIKSLQFIVSLPQKLRVLVDERNYSEAIKVYVAAKPKLEKIKDFRSVAGIYADCKSIIDRLERQLWTKIKSPVLSSEDFIENARLLCKLGINVQELETKLVTQWETQLNMQLSKLENTPNSSSDILDFVDSGVCPFLADLSLIASLYIELFPTAKDNMNTLVSGIMQRVKTLLIARFEAETNPKRCDLYVRSLDRVFRKINACSKLFTSLDLEFDTDNAAIILDAAHHQIQLCRKSITDAIKNSLSEITANLQTIKSGTGIKKRFDDLLLEWLNKLEQTYLVTVKTASANLLMFTANEFTFGTNPLSFGVDIHEKIVVGGLQDLSSLIKDENLWVEKSATLDLLFAIFLNHITKKNLTYLMDLCREQYKINEEVADSLLTRPQDLIKTVNDAALQKLKFYVDKNSHYYYELLEVNDSKWVEMESVPTSVRRPVVNFIHAIEKLDHQLQMLLDDSTKKERTPESIRNSRKYNIVSKPTDNQSSLEKMWADTVEEFGSPVLEFKRHSIVGCLVDKALKLFLDWIRKQKFSRFAVQQLQVDCFYQKQYLWKNVVDEMATNVLIDEFLTTAVNLCLDPKLLEPTVVKEICDKK